MDELEWMENEECECEFIEENEVLKERGREGVRGEGRVSPQSDTTIMHCVSIEGGLL